MSWLQILWFFLLFVLFSGFFVLEGFDFGVGMSTKLLARNSDEEDQLVATIGPHWDGNEVWLITAGGDVCLLSNVVCQPLLGVLHHVLPCVVRFDCSRRVV